jgi:hypothetical protein
LTLDLRNDFVTLSLHAEAIDISAAEEDAQIGGDLLEIEAEGGDFVPIERDLKLWLIVFQIIINKAEEAALTCFR